MAELRPSPLNNAHQGTRGWTCLACGLLIAVTVVLNQSAVHWRQNVADSHLFGYYGWCVAHGARPYLDVWDNKPPGIWWLNAAGFLLCGEGMGGELLICAAALAVTLGALAGLVRLAYHRSLTILGAATGCVLLSHLLYEGGANRTEPFVSACECVAVLGYLCWWRGRRWGWLFLAGLAAGAAPLFKQSGLAAGVACALHLAWTQLRAVRGPGSGWRCWLVAGGAFIAPPLAAAAVLGAQGALSEARYAVTTFNRAYFAIGDATWLRVDRALAVYAESIGPLRWLLVAAGAGLVCVLVSRMRALRDGRTASAIVDEAGGGRGPGAVALFWLWFAVALYAACVGPGRRGHHFLPVLAPLGLLALYPLHLLVARHGLAARATARPTTVALLVLFVGLLAELGVRQATELTRCWAVKPTWHALSYATAQDYQLQADEIRKLAAPSERIYVWGWSPGTYRYAYRLPASRYATLEKLGQVGNHARFILDGAIADIRRNEPKVFVVSVGDWRGLRTDPDSEFAQWLTARYVDCGLVGGMHILLRQVPTP
jgi:hypothetical protein